MNRQLVDAVDRNDIEGAMLLLEKGASANARDQFNWTVLMRACNMKNKAMVDLLVKGGAKVNETDLLGQTALMLATSVGDKAIFDILLKHDVDVMKKNKAGWTVVHFAAAKNRKTLLDQLLLPCSHFPCWSLTVDLADDDGRTPLWWAACGGHVDCVGILLVHGANPDQKSENYGSPLDIAMTKGHTSIVSMMTEALKSPLLQYAIRVISKLKENISSQEMEVLELKRDNELLQEDLKRSVQQIEMNLTAEIQQKNDQLKDEQLKELSSVLTVVERIDEQAGPANDSFLTLDTIIKSSDGIVQPVTSSTSSEIGPEGGRVKFQSSDVFLDVPQGAISSNITFSLETYIDPSYLPPATIKDEVPLSPAFHFSSSLPQGHHFTKPLQLSLPLEVPPKASDCDSGWLLQLKRSKSSNDVPSGWHTVLEFNTKTGENVYQSSFVHYDHANGTLCLDHFCWFAWLGQALKTVGSLLVGLVSPMRQIDYAVFGKEIQQRKWLIALHIIHRSRTVYESLVHKLKEKDYVELTYPNTDCIQLDGDVSVHVQCLEPWQVLQGKPEVQITTNRIWGSGQHSSCYHEVTIEDSNCSADTLECTIIASFRPKGDQYHRDAVELVISRPLQLTQPEAAAVAVSLSGIRNSEDRSSSTSDGSTFDTEEVFQAVVNHGCNRWYSLCVQMGYSSGQVEGITSRIPNDADKIRAVFNNKIDAVGESAATAALLEACKCIPNPIIGGVMDILSK